MSVSAISSASAAPVQTPAPVAARAADGDYIARGAQTSQTKDSDGDYKPLAAATSPAAQSSNATQSALSVLAKGG